MPFVSVIAILVFDLALLPGFCILHFVLLFAEHLTSYLSANDSASHIGFVC